MQKKITVLMAVHNGEKYLREAIESILTQSFAEFEFLIVDDGSTDDSPNILGGFRKKDERIHVIRSDKNLGLPGALNEGLKLAKGKYIARMDADDIAAKDRLRLQYEFLQSNPDIFLLGARIMIIDGDGSSLYAPSVLTDPESIKKTLPRSNCFAHPTIMFRNEGQILYREKMTYAQDYDLYLRLLSEGRKMANLNKVLLRYRYVPSPTSTKKAKQSLFAQRAREFYEGATDYDNFDPASVSREVEGLGKPQLRQIIYSSFCLLDIGAVRFWGGKYLSRYGHDAYFAFFLLSLIPRFILKYMVRILFFLRQLTAKSA